MRSPLILLIDPSLALRRGLKAHLPPSRFDVMEAGDAAEASRLVVTRGGDLAIVGASAEPNWDGIAMARRFRLQHAGIPVILAAPQSSEDSVIAALRAGVTDYLKMPVSAAELVSSVEAGLDSAHQAERRPRLCSAPDLGRMIGRSPAVEHLRRTLPRVALANSNVLITGETGTGKELIAQLVHALSPRRQGPLVCLNCAAIPDGLFESELFGYERGAFTGAHAQRDGKLKLASGGTVFFDEIGDMSPYAQAKILRIIETGEVYPLGARRVVPVNVRVIAATNEPLESLVAQGRFRKDLYFRLNVARIHLPPLRERREDIPLLSDHCIGEINARLGVSITGIGSGARQHLQRHDWPGNVRQLRNTLESAAVTLRVGEIHEVDLPDAVWPTTAPPVIAAADELHAERDRVLSALRVTNWNKSQAARSLHWSRMTLYRKIAKYSIGRSEKTPVSQPSGDGAMREA